MFEDDVANERLCHVGINFWDHYSSYYVVCRLRLPLDDQISFEVRGSQKAFCKELGTFCSNSNAPHPCSSPSNQSCRPPSLCRSIERGYGSVQSNRLQGDHCGRCLLSWKGVLPYQRNEEIVNKSDMVNKTYSQSP